MGIAVILVWAMAPAAAATPAESVDQEILVVARKAMTIKYQAGRDKKTGAIVCRIKRSSGDRILDARICETALTCIPANASNRDVDAIRACLEPRQKQVVEARAAERVAAARRR